MRVTAAWVLAALLCAAACSDNGGAESDAGADVVADVPGPEDTREFSGEDDAVTDTRGTAETDTGGSPYPDPAFVHVLHADKVVNSTAPFAMDEPTLYRTVDVLPALDVRTLSSADGQLWVGTAAGLFRYAADSDSFAPVAAGAVTGPVSALARRFDPLGRLAACAGGLAVLVDPEAGTALPVDGLPDGMECTAVALGGDHWYFGAQESGVYRVLAADAAPAAEPLFQEAFTPTALAAGDGGRLWIGTAAGLRVWDGNSVESFNAAGGHLPDDEVRALAVNADGSVIFAGTATGIARFEDGASRTLTAGIDRLPYDDVLALDLADDRLVLGQGIGATALLAPTLAEGSPFARRDYYTSYRWVPDNRVQAVAVLDADTYWLGTPAGLTRVDWRERTLADKAAFHEQLLEDHFWRMDGFVASDAYVEDPWAMSIWSVSDKDNDGLWTQMQIGAWCYAYAATGDEAFYQRARKAMENMMLQVDVPAVDFEAAGLGRGFVTRSLVRDDEGGVYESKATQDNWHPVHYEGRDYYWKDDTSSDEIAGHFYGYPLYYDLCAKDEAERAEVASYAEAIARYIVEHDYVLIDLDGEKTFHGHWSPQLIGSAALGIDACLAQADKEADTARKFEKVQLCYESWAGGGWLNATEILGLLLSTWHMTGDPFFYDEYVKLVTEHHYDKLVSPHDETLTITSPSVMNHSDHELAMLAYHTLIRYEPDDARRQQWMDGLLFLYEWELPERNPLWAGFVALLAGAEHAELAPALESLRQMPSDRREWLVDNSHRKDAVSWPDDRHGDAQWDRIFPYDEIRTIWWNGNLRVKKGGGNPKDISGPMAWLLPYYALVYAGVIAP